MGREDVFVLEGVDAFEGPCVSSLNSAAPGPARPGPPLAPGVWGSDHAVRVRVAGRGPCVERASCFSSRERYGPLLGRDSVSI